MTRILGLDPGRESPGYACGTWVSNQPPPFAVDVIVVETGGWAGGAMGGAGLWGLGFGAAMRVAGVLTTASPSATVYVVSPAVWRAALPPVPGVRSLSPKLPKPVIVNVLRARLSVRGVDCSAWTDDMVEAHAIAEAAAVILSRPKAKDRKGLRKVQMTDYGWALKEADE